ncbi:serine hydrolase domain-containing protein [Roseateles cavernae]|uniref:serine hydrolase domain-containing protein n=1 Tax=Roseateles cavernae TaxID=3153578 RepID=UPI0032E4CD50
MLISRAMLGAALLLLPTLFLGCGGGNDAALATPPLDRKAVQALVDKAVPAEALPGALVALREASGPTLGFAAGRGRIEPAAALRAEARFRAGSVLKLLIATVVLQLVEEGRLSLAAPLGELLPPDRVGRFNYRGQITLEQLLNHSSGLGDTATGAAHDADVLSHPGKLRSEQDYLDAALLEPQQPPGAHAYANTNYILLGLIIDRAAGRSWRAEVQQRLFARLGMRDSSLPEPADLEMPAPFAHGYESVEGVGLVDVSRISPSMAGAAGGHALVTSTADLARFAAALFGGALYRSPATLERMLRFVPAEPIGDMGYAYGLGVMRHQLPDGRVFLGHGGASAGYSCAILYDPSRRLVVVAARNGSDLGSTYLDLALPVARYLQQER